MTKCAYCFSTDVRIVSSEPNRDVAILKCSTCGKTFPVDVENLNTDPPAAPTPERGPGEQPVIQN